MFDQFQFFFFRGSILKYIQWVSRPAPDRTPFYIASLKGLLAPLMAAVRLAGLVTLCGAFYELVCSEAFYPLAPEEACVRAAFASSEKVGTPLAPLMVGDIRENRLAFIPPEVKPKFRGCSLLGTVTMFFPPPTIMESVGFTPFY